MYKFINLVAAVTMFTVTAIPTLAQTDSCTQEQAVDAVTLIEDRNLFSLYDDIQAAIVEISETAQYGNLLKVYVENAAIYNVWRNEVESTFPDCRESKMFVLHYNVAYSDRLLQLGLMTAAFENLSDEDTLSTLLEMATTASERVDMNVISIVIWNASLQSIAEDADD